MSKKWTGKQYQKAKSQLLNNVYHSEMYLVLSKL